MDCTADLLLIFVWDETASETARSKTENIHSFPFSTLLLAVPEAVLSHTKTRSRSAVQPIFCVAPCCTRGSLVPYKSDENQFHPVLALLGTGAPMKKPITIIQVKNITFQGKLSIEAKNHHKSQRDKSECSLSWYIKIV